MDDLSKHLYRDANYCQRCAAPMRLRVDHEGKTRAVCEACGFVLYRNPIPVVAILDSRMATARYAGYLRASLPPYWATTDSDKVRLALQRLREAVVAK